LLSPALAATTVKTLDVVRVAFQMILERDWHKSGRGTRISKERHAVSTRVRLSETRCLFEGVATVSFASH